MAEISFRWHLEHISYLKFQRIIKCVALYSIVDHLPLKLISLKSFMLVQFRYFITLFICRFTWCTIQQMTSLEVMPLLSMNMNETCTVSIAQFFVNVDLQYYHLYLSYFTSIYMYVVIWKEFKSKWHKPRLIFTFLEKTLIN